MMADCRNEGRSNRSGCRNGVNGASTMPLLVNSRRRNYINYTTSWRPVHSRSSSTLRILFILLVVSWAWIALFSMQKLNLLSNDKDDNRSRHGHREEIVIRLQPYQSVHSNSHIPCDITDNRKSLKQQHNNNHRFPKYTIENPPVALYDILHGVFTPFSIGRLPPSPKLSYNTSQTMEQNRALFDRARFRLFQTFCSTSMRYQTSTNAFWIIVVDEFIGLDIMNDLSTLLLLESSQGMDGNNTPTKSATTPFLVAVPSVALYPPESSISFGWYDMIREYGNGNLNIVTGDKEKLIQALELMKYHSLEQPMSSFRSQKPHLLLETRLDVDFGIHKNGIEWIQDAVLRHAQEQERRSNSWKWSWDRTSVTSPSWWYLCGTEHLEWHNPDIYLLRKRLFTELGISTGRTGLRVRPHVCAMGGLTRVGVLSKSLLSTDMHIPNVSQELLTNETVDMYGFLEKLPPCGNSRHSTNNGISSTPLHLESCLIRTFSESPLVIQARGGPAMDGNRPMNPNEVRAMKAINKEFDGPLLINRTELDWDLLSKDFNIHRYTVWDMSLFMYEHAANILLGHPCAMTDTANTIFTDAVVTRSLCVGWDQNAASWMLKEVANRDLELPLLPKGALINQQRKVSIARNASVAGHPLQKSDIKETTNRKHVRRVSAPNK
jgi:hypothetical protein